MAMDQEINIDSGSMRETNRATAGRLRHALGDSGFHGTVGHDYKGNFILSLDKESFERLIDQLKEGGTKS